MWDVAAATDACLQFTVPQSSLCCQQSLHACTSFKWPSIAISHKAHLRQLEIPIPGIETHSTCAVASCCVFAKLYRFVLSRVSVFAYVLAAAGCWLLAVDRLVNNKHQVLHAAGAAFVLQPPGRRFLFLSSQARSIVHSSTWPIVSAVVGFVSCRVLQLFRISCVSLHLPASPAAARCAYCFDSFCQIYIKFITAHASKSQDS